MVGAAKEGGLAGVEGAPNVGVAVGVVGVVVRRAAKVGGGAGLGRAELGGDPKGLRAAAGCAGSGAAAGAGGLAGEAPTAKPGRTTGLGHGRGGMAAGAPSAGCPVGTGTAPIGRADIAGGADGAVTAGGDIRGGADGAVTAGGGFVIAGAETAGGGGVVMDGAAGGGGGSSGFSSGRGSPILR